jgi:hypothetical protein
MFREKTPVNRSASRREFFGFAVTTANALRFADWLAKAALARGTSAVLRVRRRSCCRGRSALVATLMLEMSSVSAANFLSADSELLDISFASDSRVVFFAAICGEYSMVVGKCTVEAWVRRGGYCRISTLGGDWLAISGNAWGRARKQKMKHPQCDQEGDQSRTNDVVSIQTTHGSILSCCGRQQSVGRSRRCGWKLR